MSEIGEVVSPSVKPIKPTIISEKVFKSPELGVGTKIGLGVAEVAIDVAKYLIEQGLQPLPGVTEQAAQRRYHQYTEDQRKLALARAELAELAENIAAVRRGKAGREAQTTKPETTHIAEKEQKKPWTVEGVQEELGITGDYLRSEQRGEDEKRLQDVWANQGYYTESQAKRAWLIEALKAQDLNKAQEHTRQQFRADQEGAYDTATVLDTHRQSLQENTVVVKQGEQQE